MGFLLGSPGFLLTVNLAFYYQHLAYYLDTAGRRAAFQRLG